MKKFILFCLLFTLMAIPCQAALFYSVTVNSSAVSPLFVTINNPLNVTFSHDAATTTISPNATALFIISPNATAQFKVVNGATAASPILVSGNASIVNNSNTNPLYVSPNGTAQFKIATPLDVSMNYYKDPYWASVRTIGSTHSSIHRGEHFFVNSFESETNGSTIAFFVKTPNSTKLTHMTFRVKGTSQLEMYIYESAVPSTNGTVATPINSNRNSATVSSLSITKDATIVTTGNLLAAYSSGLAGTPPSLADTGGDVEREDELVLKSNTQYLFYIISRDTNVITYHGNWYEHIPD